MKRLKEKVKKINHKKNKESNSIDISADDISLFPEFPLIENFPCNLAGLPFWLKQVLPEEIALLKEGHLPPENGRFSKIVNAFIDIMISFFKKEAPILQENLIPTELNTALLFLDTPFISNDLFIKYGTSIEIKMKENSEDSILGYEKKALDYLKDCLSRSEGYELAIPDAIYEQKEMEDKFLHSPEEGLPEQATQPQTVFCSPPLDVPPPLPVAHQEPFSVVLKSPTLSLKRFPEQATSNQTLLCLPPLDDAPPLPVAPPEPFTIASRSPTLRLSDKRSVKKKAVVMPIIEEPSVEVSVDSESRFLPAATYSINYSEGSALNRNGLFAVKSEVVEYSSRREVEVGGSCFFQIAVCCEYVFCCVCLEGKKAEQQSTNMMQFPS